MNLLAQKESKPLFHVYDIESDKTTNSKTLEYFEKIRNFSILQPKKHDNRSFGNCLCLFFYKGEPLISIGPHCKIKKYIFYCLYDFYIMV